MMKLHSPHLGLYFLDPHLLTPTQKAVFTVSLVCVHHNTILAELSATLCIALYLLLPLTSADTANNIVVFPHREIPCKDFSKNNFFECAKIWLYLVTIEIKFLYGRAANNGRRFPRISSETDKNDEKNIKINTLIENELKNYEKNIKINTLMENKLN